MSMSVIEKKLLQQKQNNVTLKSRKHSKTNGPTSDSASSVNVKLSKSYPNLNVQTNKSSLIKSMRISKSDSNIVQKINKNARKTDSNYMHTKSEVCLRTITVRNTSFDGSSASTSTLRERYENRDLINEQRRMSSRGDNVVRSSSRSSFSNSNYEPVINSSCIRVPIIGYEVMEERARFTIFKLRIENNDTKNCWLVLRRYTDFVRLHNKLKSLFPAVNLILPRKKWFGDNFSRGFLDNRIQGLQYFVNSVMSNESLRNSTIVREFFCLDEPPTYSESMEECRAIFEAQEETIAHLKQQLYEKEQLLAVLHNKFSKEMQHNELLKTVIKKTYGSCSKCSKDLDNHLQDETSTKQILKNGKF